MMGSDLNDEVLIPSMSFSLAAVVRKQRQHQPSQQQYAMVHEKPPRGWWLPGGGIEHKDDTPVHGAIRETLEEAGAPSLLPLLPLASQSMMRRMAEEEEEPKLRLLPSMTHLLSLQQSRGRLRFIFRGEWIDDVGDCDNETAVSDDEPKSILKCLPGDEESMESKWLTWDEIQCLEEKKGKKGGKRATSQLQPTNTSKAVQCFSDPYLRGHEPLEFYGMLERSWQENASVPGIPVHMMDFSKELKAQREEGVTGAFFGRMENTSNKSNQTLIVHGRRAALLVHFKCRLVLYDMNQQRIALDAETKKFPSSHVKDQNNVTLKELVHGMIKGFVTRPRKEDRENKKHYRVGMLRVEHVIHANGREATLTVFPVVCFSPADGVHPTGRADRALNWVSGEEIGDNLERNLAKAVLAEKSGENNVCSLSILRDKEGPL
eukprot:CAMPEP_0196143916 /NCGR_PEP_ID=MMETSP0910-20130528/14015_1 /TAXON_ID=49265 /ORGANISM="Thalassiosira rotula, Strain GSO102" /LENGTH=432 /DNA_ID=CAMNT_0041405425 /DNA_START=221 /DNA_END=1519 /DNA_ORIENTATION=+